MNWPKNRELEDWQADIPFDDIRLSWRPWTWTGNDRPWNPSDEDMAVIFPKGTQSLTTWGRTAGTKQLDPHWIAVQSGTPLHTDPGYPRWSHHLILRVTEPATLHGMSADKGVDLCRGQYYRLDGHSPHRLRHLGPKPRWYVACSIDSDEPQDADEMIRQLITYAVAAEHFPKDFRHGQKT